MKILEAIALAMKKDPCLQESYFYKREWRKWEAENHILSIAHEISWTAFGVEWSRCNFGVVTGDNPEATLQSFLKAPIPPGWHNSLDYLDMESQAQFIPISILGDQCDDDDWTVRTKDGSLSAQFEHTILVTPTGFEVLTLRENEVIPH